MSLTRDKMTESMLPEDQDERDEVVAHRLSELRGEACPALFEMITIIPEYLWNEDRMRETLLGSTWSVLEGFGWYREFQSFFPEHQLRRNFELIQDPGNLLGLVALDRDRGTEMWSGILITDELKNEGYLYYVIKAEEQNPKLHFLDKVHYRTSRN